MDYAIIQFGDLLEILKLSDWNSWEWDDFSTVKSKKDNDIMWFFDESDAIDFMLENFGKGLIHPKYLEYDDIGFNDDYYID